MTDESNYVTKADLEVLLASLKQEISNNNTAILKEFDVRENKIHSSYAKKLKNQPATEEEVDDAAPNRRPTKREMELQEKVEKLLTNIDDANRRAALANQRSNFADTLLKNGFRTEAVDTVYTLFEARKAFVDDGNGGFKVKVNVESAGEVALPLDQALKHYAKSTEAQFYMTPKGAQGTGSRAPQVANSRVEKPAANFKDASAVQIDWDSVKADLNT